jgi:hypothetical protein
VRPLFIGTTIAIGAVACITITAGSAVGQNTLAERGGRAADGVVHVQFAARAGTCGDGKDLIGYRRALFAESFQSIGKWDAPNCQPGPVRAALYVSGGKVTRVKAYVSGNWPRTGERVTDIGAVPPGEAAAYFFGLIPQIERSENKGRLLLPAVLADDPLAVQRLISLSRDESRIQNTRGQAIQWIGLLGDARVVPVLVAFARGGGATTVGEDIDEDDEAPGEKGLATTAMAALSSLDNGAGVPALIEVLR